MTPTATDLPRHGPVQPDSGLASILRRCRTSGLDDEVIEDSPAWRSFDDVVYLPHSPDHRWGLLKDGVQVASQAAASPAAMPVLPKRLEADEAPFIYVGRIVSHYGHFVCDVLSWAWLLAGWEGAKPRLLCHSDVPRAAWENLDFVRTIMEGLGLSAADLVTFERPTRLGQVLYAEPSFGAAARPHRVFQELCLGIGRPLWSESAVDSVVRPAYLSKARLPAGMIRMANEAELDAALAARGVDIVYPEELAFADQVRLFATRRTIMGTAGSALHTALFAPAGRRILGLHWSADLYAYFPQIDRLCDHEGRYYTPVRAGYVQESGYNFGWVLPEPERVADELLARVAAWATLDQRDAADDAARARLSYRVADAASTFVHRAARRVRARLGWPRT